MVARRALRPQPFAAAALPERGLNAARAELEACVARPAQAREAEQAKVVARAMEFAASVAQPVQVLAQARVRVRATDCVA